MLPVRKLCHWRKQVKLDRYAKVRPTTFGLVGRKRIAVIRASGTIVGGESRTGGNISSEEVGL